VKQEELMSDSTVTEIARKQLRRLETLTDCVYALALVQVMSWLPLPEESAAAGEGMRLLDLFSEFSGNLVAALIGLCFIIIYWLRSNELMAYLDRTDSTHTAFSIASVAALLLLVYVIRVSAEVAAPARRSAESVAVLLIGLMSAAAWAHARRRGLVRQGVGAEESSKVRLEAYTEPIVALITLPVAYVGDVAWHLAWLTYFPVAALLRRRAAKEDGE